MSASPDSPDGLSAASPLRRAATRTIAHLAGGPLTPGVRAFGRNLAWLSGSDLLASFITFWFSAWAIRVMGPADFGVASLTISAAQLAAIPMLFGLHASTSRAVAATQTPGPVLGSTLLLTGLLIPAVALVGAAFAGPIAGLTGLSRLIVLASLPLAAALVLQTVLQGMMAGLQRFKEFSRFSVLAAIVYAALLAAGLSGGVTWVAWLYVGLTGLRSLVLAILCLADVWSGLRRPTREALWTLAHFGGVFTIGSVANFFAIGAIDSLMLNAWHGTAAVGLYGAYFAAFNIIVSRVIKILTVVLIPAATAHRQPRRIAERAVRGLLGPAWAIVPATMLLARFVFLMYGNAYVFSWTTAALLGLCIYLQVGTGVSAALMVAGGLESLRFASSAAALTAIINVAGNFLLIPSYAVDGSLLATAASSAIGLTLRMAYLLKSRPK